MNGRAGIEMTFRQVVKIFQPPEMYKTWDHLFKSFDSDPIMPALKRHYLFRKSFARPVVVNPATRRLVRGSQQLVALHQIGDVHNTVCVTSDCEPELNVPSASECEALVVSANLVLDLEQPELESVSSVEESSA